MANYSHLKLTTSSYNIGDQVILDVTNLSDPLNPPTPNPDSPIYESDVTRNPTSLLVLTGVYRIYLNNTPDLDGTPKQLQASSVSIGPGYYAELLNIFNINSNFYIYIPANIVIGDYYIIGKWEVPGGDILSNAVPVTINGVTSTNYRPRITLT